MARALLDRLRAHRAKLHRAVRVAVAAAVAYELATRLDLPQGFWAVITAVIVMQSSVGGTLAASIDRMVGTVGGAVVGAAVAVVSSWTKMPEVLGLVAAIIPLSIAASVYQSMRIAPVTAAIMLLASPEQRRPAPLRRRPGVRDRTRQCCRPCGGDPRVPGACARHAR